MKLSEIKQLLIKEVDQLQSEFNQYNENIDNAERHSYLGGVDVNRLREVFLELRYYKVVLDLINDVEMEKRTVIQVLDHIVDYPLLNARHLKADIPTNDQDFVIMIRTFAKVYVNYFKYLEV